MQLITICKMGCFISDRQKRELRTKKIKRLSKVIDEAGLQSQSSSYRSRLHMLPLSQKLCGWSSQSPCRGPLSSLPSTYLYILPTSVLESTFLPN